MNTKKCIVVDLDNTLWGGIIGEDGMRGISLAPSGVGASFIAFQQAILDIQNRGVILAINSRNNPEEALAVIRSHPNMILKESHFSAMRINWNDKVENLKELAEELRLGLDSMVFLDDDPVNRAQVRAMLPMVEVPELPSDPREYAKFLHALPYFPETAITDEDKMRSNLYVTERLRAEAEKSFENREEFLSHLGLELTICVDDATSLARLAQLTEKTNQFNTNKVPLSEEAIQELIHNPDARVVYGRLTDRFGDYGITNVAIVERREEGWHITSFLMSCRVIGRGVESTFLSVIANLMKKEGATHIAISFVKTDKNSLAESFVQKHFPESQMPVDALIQFPPWMKMTYGKI